MPLCEHLSGSTENATRTDHDVMGTPGRRWFVVHTQNHREACARSHLSAQGFCVFLPRFTKNVRHARQSKTVNAPLFPRYLFVALDLRRDRWRSINGTHGVTSILTQDDRPCAVPVGVVESLSARCDADQIVRCPELRPGQDVRVIAGPFAEQLGVIERLGGSERVRVLLEIMNCSLAVDLSRSAITPARPLHPG